MEPSPRSSASRRSNLTLDLSGLPPFPQPTPPSNTLLFTNLNNTDVFRPASLQTLRELVTKMAPIHAFAPLKLFRRIVISFWNTEGAVAVRQAWDGEAVLGEKLRVYFGQPTPVEVRGEHLALPDAGKLFFISPPPSPPHGWEARLEDAPNRMVHADDLAEALARLHHHARPRSRSSTLIWRPDADGCGPGLPAVVVEDMTDEPADVSPLEGTRPIMAHTVRPPVELMHDA